MKLKTACADFTFPLVTHDHALDLITMLGVTGVDIGLFHNRSHLQPTDQFQNVARSARNLKKKLDERGLKAADIFLQVADNVESHAINHPQASRRKKATLWYENTIEYAARCGARHVTTPPGVYFPGQTKAASWGRACDELAWRVELARRNNITLGVEAHIGSIAPRPAAAQRLIKAIPGLTLTLDYTHFTHAGIPDRQVEPLVQHASHFHIRGGAKGRLQCSYADNTINYKRVLKVMKETGYRGYIGLEYCWTVWARCNEVDNLSETILFRDFLKTINL